MVGFGVVGASAKTGVLGQNPSREQIPSAAEFVQRLDDAESSIPGSRFWLPRNRNGSLRDPSAGPMMRVDEVN